MIEQLERRTHLAATITTQAEDFVAYSDTTPTNLLGAYRDTPVDIGKTTDTGGGYLVGNIRPKEYLEYNINVPTTGQYDIQFRVAAATGYGGTFHMNVNSTNRTQSINLPATGGWDKWTTVTKSDITLYSGTQKFRIVFDSANKVGQDIGGVNWFKLVPRTTTTPSSNWPSSTAWKKVSNAPISRFESYAFSYKGKLYELGGWKNSKFESTKRVDVYDPASNTWSRRADMQAPETHSGMAVDATNGVVYFVGGHRGKYPSVATDEVWKYTIATDKWTKLAVKLPKKLGANSAQVVEGKLHSISGNPSDRVTNIGDHYVLDLSNISAGFKTAASLPSPRDHTSGVVLNGKIYVIGGEFGHDKKHLQQKLVHVYDPKTNKWTRLADAPVSKSHAESSVFIWKGKIIWAGGQSTPQNPTKGVVQYDPATNKWSTLSSLPASRQGTTVQLVGNYFVFTGGGIKTSQPQSDTWVYNIVT